VIHMVALYFEVGLALALASVLFAAAVGWRGAGVDAAPSRWAALGWGMIALAIAAPIGWRVLGVGGLRPASLEIWSARGPAMGELYPTGQATVRAARAAGVWKAGDGLAGLWVGRQVAILLVAFLLIGVFIAVGQRIWRARQLRALCAGLPVCKAIGQVRLCVGDGIGAPFAARSGGRAYVVVPSALLLDPARLRLVIAHEAAHHRRGDLRLAPWLAAVRAFFFWNPLLGRWERALRALEDLACDLRVLARPRVDPAAYAQALLWAVGAAGGSTGDLRAARAMASASVNHATLRRRILMLHATRRSAGRRATGLVLGGGLMLAVLCGSWAVRGAVSERRLGIGEVAAAAAHIEATQGLPVLSHERVVARLNSWLAQPEKRAQLKQALARMEQYRPMMEPILDARKLPRALMAVALLESGFDNDAHTDRPVERRSAGIWQFLPGTGRKMGLEVSATRDERLDPRRATEAAAAFFETLHQRFADWPIAIAAYNGGTATIGAIVDGLPQEQARRRLLEDDKEFGRYLVGVTAAMIVCDNPSLLD
jgi:membrane-bound lytic murein transglycosylase D